MTKNETGAQRADSYSGWAEGSQVEVDEVEQQQDGDQRRQRKRCQRANENYSASQLQQCAQEESGEVHQESVNICVPIYG